MKPQWFAVLCACSAGAAALRAPRRPGAAAPERGSSASPVLGPSWLSVAEAADPHHGHGGEPEEHGHGEPEEHGGLGEAVIGESILEGHEGGHSEKSQVLSVTLMGVVAFCMSLFYLVNSPSEHIRRYTWKIVSMTVSIFCAVLLYGMVHIICEDVLVKAGAIAEHDELAMMVLDLSIGLLLFVLLNLLLWYLRHQHTKVHTCATILAHMVGFAAMYGFAAMQDLEFCRESLLMAIGVFCLAAVVLGVLGTITAHIHHRVLEAPASERLKERLDREEWEESVEEAEDDAVGLCLGFLLTQVARFAITGHLQPWEAHEAEEYHPFSHRAALLACGVGFGILTASGTVVIHSMKLLGKETGRTVHVSGRLAKLARHICSTAMAFCLVYYGEWQLARTAFTRPRIGAALLLTLVMTMLCIPLIFAFNAAAEHDIASPKALRSIIVGLGVLVGLLFERAFDIALVDIGAYDPSGVGTPSKGLRTVLVGLFLVGVVLPAWHMYIMPKAKQDRGDTGESGLED